MCVQRMVLVLPPAFRSRAVSVKILLLHHQGSFHFLPTAWPGPGPQVGGKAVFPTPTPPLTSAQPSCARRAGCTFPYLQHKTSLFLHPGHVHAQSARDGRWGGGPSCRGTGSIYQVPASFPCCLGILFVSRPMAVISNGSLGGQSPWCSWCGVRSVSCSPEPGASAH